MPGTLGGIAVFAAYLACPSPQRPMFVGIIGRTSSVIVEGDIKTLSGINRAGTTHAGNVAGIAFGNRHIARDFRNICAVINN